MPPRIENAPGLTWRKRKAGWEARWQCHTDIARRGYRPRTYRIWCEEGEPDEFAVAFIQDRCKSLQDEMLVWSRGGVPVETKFDGTVDGLILCYQHDADSPFRKVRYKTKEYYRSLCKRLKEDFGDKQIAEMKARLVLHWHEKVLESGHVAMGHSVMGMLRVIANFGATFLEDEECERLSGVLSKMRFKAPKARSVVLTAEQATAIRSEAHRAGYPSIALAQAFQFECTFRQKDVIGEYVPLNETGLSDIIDGNEKWLRGIRWEEIDANWMLTHVTSKQQKEITIDLKLAGMVMEEIGNKSRDQFPANGPVILNESTKLPWSAQAYRKRWRALADNAGVPKHIRSMDSRAGAITEATEADVPLEFIRHAATHSDVSMTQRYARQAEEKTAEVMRQRAEHRKNKTK